MRDKHSATNGEKVKYSRYKPNMYLPEMSIFWWIKQKPYLVFIIRELTSLFVAAYALFLMFQVYALRSGPEQWEALLIWLYSPFSVSLHIVILVFVLFHSITWFQLTPKTFVLRFSGKKIPDGVIVSVNFVVWLLISLAAVRLFILI